MPCDQLETWSSPSAELSTRAPARAMAHSVVSAYMPMVRRQAMPTTPAQTPLLVAHRPRRVLADDGTGLGTPDERGAVIRSAPCWREPVRGGAGRGAGRTDCRRRHAAAALSPAGALDSRAGDGVAA